MRAEAGQQQITIVCERPIDALSTGVRLRVNHLRDAYRSLGYVTDVMGAYDQDTTGTRAALTEADDVARRLSPALPRSIVVCGLGGVRLLALSRALSNIGHLVHLDECDSLALQLWSSLKRGRLREVCWEGLRVGLHVAAPRRVDISYISTRDARMDALLNVGRRVTVRPPTADAALAVLPPVDVRKRLSVVVPADFQSPHLQRGLSMMWAATTHGSPVEVRLFGPRRPDRELTDGLTYRGYLPDVASVYAGDTVVFIANVGGAGVPNKLVEAASAGRPVIVHPSVRKRVDLPMTGWTFRSSSDVSRVLRSIADGALPRPL